MILRFYNWQKWWLLLGLFSVSASDYNQPFEQPNILFVMVDDMGWNDVSYHGSDQISTPNLDALATSGVIFKQYYSEAICTPARTALLTGKYPMRLGMQGMPLYNSEDRGIPLTERLLPARLKERGYKTHLVGKWHVGMSKKEYLPTSRGYHSHYGIRGGFVDYYTYNKIETWPDGRLLYGLDFFDNDIPQTTEERYVVDALTDRAIEIIHNHNTSCPLFLHYTSCAPHAGNAGGALQPPLNSYLGNRHIANSDRRLYAEVVTHLDYSVGRLVRALSDKGILHNTIIVFISDNGAPTVGQFSNWGINLPFRGRKQTPWEGGVRVPAFIWHASLKPKVYDGLMHITDWMPTLLAASGGEIDEKIDGVNQWPAILQGQKSPRKEVFIAVEDRNTIYAAFRAGDYKIIIGNVTGLGNGYYGAEYLANKAAPPDYFSSLVTSDVAKVLETLGINYDYGEVMSTRRAAMVKQIDQVRDQEPCLPSPTRGCLYNVQKDPSESHNLWSRGQKITALLTIRLRALWSDLLRRGAPKLDDEADPANYNYIWLPWIDSNTSTNELSNYSGSVRNANLLTYSSNLYNYTLASNITGCESTHGFRNFICLLRSVFK
ncbi:arylsulfatase B-like isoform X1 [Colias croceus]|uniref:arylsulfatase B-like isoform X1 n=2 Tax=Colias crocea TaxID=72248 RepID=UPI001E27C465|nr:arylsulfatase B-like isoform X1 [Colias croceus]